jgi:hypothetical protein
MDIPKTSKRVYCFINLANNNPASNAISAPKKNGALGPKPVHVPTPCHNRPAINEAGNTVSPMAAL